MLEFKLFKFEVNYMVHPLSTYTFSSFLSGVYKINYPSLSFLLSIKTCYDIVWLLQGVEFYAINTDTQALYYRQL